MPGLMSSVTAERTPLVLVRLLPISREEPINAQNRAPLQPGTGHRALRRAATVFPAALENSGRNAGCHGETIGPKLTIRGQITG